ncbi:LysM peptidoglycan-binding domain-containing protein [Planococcus faecalis]|uniref:Elastin-binding protein EbpS n=1 Tax=Planococcus faecalis TaxID=1598147 RepID=A0ABN4XLK8_9BACL|nr:LysM peptidoglycan-binding domain-containing protein [Planococcus faecalis]AQU79656.1 elastin-binding protein EbpS [Planococcus faecalis]OHX51576.1 elastin-binding protein EbpS [Planococcus faecalis]
MGNQSYHESIEKNRQEISVDKNSALSRAGQRQAQKPKTKKTKNLLMPALFFIFILIPVSLLIYVAFVFEPDDSLTAKPAENEVSFEMNAQPSQSSVAAADEKEKEKAEKAKVEEAKAEKAKAEKARADAEKEKVEKAEAEAKAQAEVKAKADAEVAAKEKADVEAKAVAEAQAKKEAQAEAQAKKETQAEADKKEEIPSANGKTYVVQSSETLYRIAVNNYGAAGAAAAVEKIKQANGLSSNSISPGQTLVLP